MLQPCWEMHSGICHLPPPSLPFCNWDVCESLVIACLGPLLPRQVACCMVFRFWTVSLPVQVRPTRFPFQGLLLILKVGPLGAELSLLFGYPSTPQQSSSPTGGRVVLTSLVPGLLLDYYSPGTPPCLPPRSSFISSPLLGLLLLHFCRFLSRK